MEGAPGGSGRCGLPQPCGDAFIAKLTPAGALLGSWALGGSDNERLTSLGLDARGHVYASGYTSSCDFPVHGGARIRLPPGYPPICPATFVAELRIP